MKSILLVAFVLLSFATLASQPLATEPRVHIKNLTSHVEANRRIISWTTDGTQPVNTFEVQRSLDGKTFTTIAIVLGADPREPQESYKFPAARGSQEQQTTWYRVAHIGTNGTIEYSNSIAIAK